MFMNCIPSEASFELIRILATLDPEKLQGVFTGPPVPIRPIDRVNPETIRRGLNHQSITFFLSFLGGEYPT